MITCTLENNGDKKEVRFDTGVEAFAHLRFTAKPPAHLSHLVKVVIVSVSETQVVLRQTSQMLGEEIITYTGEPAEMIIPVVAALEMFTGQLKPAFEEALEFAA